MDGLNVSRYKKKAFDRLPYKRFLWKIEHIGGVQGNILNWMRDYLTGR